MARIPYQNIGAINYAKAYCGKKTNSCGVYLEGEKKSDCAHFIAHCLAAAGLRIEAAPDEDKLCPNGLTARNTVLEARLLHLSTTVGNVKKISLDDGIVGDVGFLQAHRPTHGFLICRPGNYAGGFSVPYVWAHSSAHCDTQLDTTWRQWFSSAYRMEDG